MNLVRFEKVKQLDFSIIQRAACIDKRFSYVILLDKGRGTEGFKATSLISSLGVSSFALDAFMSINKIKYELSHDYIFHYESKADAEKIMHYLWEHIDLETVNNDIRSKKEHRKLSYPIGFRWEDT